MPRLRRLRRFQTVLTCPGCFGAVVEGTNDLRRGNEDTEAIPHRDPQRTESLVRRWVAGLRPAHGSRDAPDITNAVRSFALVMSGGVSRSMPRVARPTASLTSVYRSCGAFVSVLCESLCE